jgi:hypothetical protein
LQQVLAPGLLRAAQERALELEIGADQVLIRWGVIEASYLQRLAAHLALETESFEAIDRAETPLRDDQMRFAAESGLVPLRRNGELRWALAPRRLAARNLCGLVKAYPSVRSRTRLTTSGSLQQFLQQQGGPALAASATSGLRLRHPDLSAAPTKQQPLVVSTKARADRDAIGAVGPLGDMGSLERAAGLAVSELCRSAARGKPVSTVGLAAARSSARP